MIAIKFKVTLLDKVLLGHSGDEKYHNMNISCQQFQVKLNDYIGDR